MTTTLHVLSAGAAKGLVLAMESTFEKTHRVQLKCQFGAVGAMRDKLLVGEPCDLIILSAALIDKLAADGHVNSDSIDVIGDVETGIAVPSDAPVPRVDDAASLRAALEAAGEIYLPDPEKATAGIHFAAVLRKLGIYDAVRARLRPYPNGAAAMAAMAAEADLENDNGLIGCTQVTEIEYTDGVIVAGVLPAEFGLRTTYSLAVCTNAGTPGLAAAFASLLTGNDSRKVREEGGFLLDA